MDMEFMSKKMNQGNYFNFYCFHLRYEGNWKDDKQFGRGCESWSSGAVFIGNFFDGMKHGEGELLFPDGSSYKVKKNSEFFRGISF